MTRKQKIKHLIINCDPSVLPEYIATGIDWDFLRCTIEKITINSYNGGDLPEFIYFQDPVNGEGYNVREIYVPADMVETAQEKYNQKLQEYGNLSFTPATIKAIQD